MRRASSDLLILAAGTIVLAFLPAIVSTYWLHVAIQALLFAYLCSAWNLVGGFNGALSFAHPIYLSIGGYMAAYLGAEYHISPWVSLLPAIVLSMVVCVCIELIVTRFKLPVLSYALATMALSNIARFVVRSIPALGGVAGLAVPLNAKGWWQFQPGSKSGFFYIILIATVAIVLIVIWFRDSKLGLQARAVRDNERAAEAIGVKAIMVRIKTGLLSAALTTFAGVFYCEFIYIADPITFLSPMLFIEVILFTAVGGMGTVWGPVVGALLLTPTGEILRGSIGATNPGVDGLIYGIIFVVIILLMPHGIVSRHRQDRSLLRRFFSAEALRASSSRR